MLLFHSQVRALARVGAAVTGPALASASSRGVRCASTESAASPDASTTKAKTGARKKSSKTTATTKGATEPGAASEGAADLDVNAATTHASQRNPFLPFKNPNTGRYIPPMSLRRQAQLAKAAHRVGMLDQLPTGPKVDKLRIRMARNEAALQREQRMAEFKAANGGQSMWSALVADVRARSKETLPETPASAAGSDVAKRIDALRVASEEAAARLARDHFATKGPYSGRNPKTMFKGHKPERQREKKLKDRAERMEAMGDTVQEWRDAKAQTKKKSQPTLPF
ncbi:unnamed protein product [Tilletia controversa]|uniref:Large ribosomal subunit protein mL59 domain-containing protein n=3 Tax=Tilletia TaxID=13289 RepID=A0A8X7T130_9BASI|nr:hypothetical protein CF336_g2458 [Tilletia laevis]KAE8204420.1 hypothetical protein CF328_g1095 [Tilletia controversa]KAE8262292.1 hypothetical protein A4X03_0g2567 [Tilletia caries]KAE8205213.1 hypothetical protein CF335_g2383 [Tilletia laevis]KAE8256052.1 hypothetical protein A4X06_0g106 [Tilletia controversa]